MAKILALTMFSLAALTAPVHAADVGHDCAEGAEEYTTSQTPMPEPTPIPPVGS